MALFSARGLTNFISEVRNAINKDAEENRVEKELAKIRNKFSRSQTLNSYEKKKYMWKLIYIYMLGYEIDFGHMQVINLLSSNQYSEKCLGYICTTILFRGNEEIMTLVINSVRNDLISSDASATCLALTYVANMGGKEIFEAIGQEIINVFLSSSGISHVRKKSSICMSKLFEINGNIESIITKEELIKRLRSLLQDPQLGVVLCAANLLYTAVLKDSSIFEPLVEDCIYKLEKLVIQKICPHEYTYYSIPIPWLQIKFLRICEILYHPFIIKNNKLLYKINDILSKILFRPVPSRGAKNNASYALLFETIHFIIGQGKDGNNKLKEQAIILLGKFIEVNESNIRYIALGFMSKLMDSHRYQYSKNDLIVIEIKKYQLYILQTLKDPDISVRKRALNFLFSIVDTDSVIEILNEMLIYLEIADYDFREELVLKIAILAEKYAPNVKWYADTIFQLLSIAGDKVTDDIWFRLVKVIKNNKELQKYISEKVYFALKSKQINEKLVKFGAYILGEFGFLLSENEEKNLIITGDQQLDVLMQHFSQFNLSTNYLLLTSFAKLQNVYPEIQSKVNKIYEKYRTDINIEIQQRAWEYSELNKCDKNIMNLVLESMPQYSFNKEGSMVENQLNDKNAIIATLKEHSNSNNFLQPLETNGTNVSDINVTKDENNEIFVETKETKDEKCD